MSQVFISYSRRDIDIASQLAEDFEKAGFDVWWDIPCLKGGDVWIRTIQEALEASKYCVVVLSPDAIESKWVEKEYTYAISLGLKIIPVLCKNCRVPMALANIQYIDLRGNKFKSGRQEVLSAFDGDPERPRTYRIFDDPFLRRLKLPIVAVVLVLLVAGGILFWPDIRAFLFPTTPATIPTSTVTVTNLMDAYVRFTITHSTEPKRIVPAGGTLTLMPGDVVLVEMSVTLGQSPFPRDLTYRYSASRGSISEKHVGPRASYDAPEQPGPDAITVLITDQETGDEILRGINILVEEKSP